MLAIGIGITGGIHLDGLIDTADGIAAGKDKCLQAMRDSNVGAIGLGVFVIVLLIQLAALIQLDAIAPIAMPIANFWGRCSPLWAIERFSYLHENQKPSFHKKHWEREREIKPSIINFCTFICILYFLPTYSYNNLSLVIVFGLGLIPTLLVPEILGRHLGGHSGDSYGASVVIVETCILLFIAFAVV